MSGYIEDEAWIIEAGKAFGSYPAPVVEWLVEHGINATVREAARRELLRRRVMGGRG